MPEKIKENKSKIVFIIGAVCLAAGAVLLILWLIGISAIKAACSPIQCILAVVIGALVLTMRKTPRLQMKPGYCFCVTQALAARCMR